jgi:hypothetical protein
MGIKASVIDAMVRERHTGPVRTTLNLGEEASRLAKRKARELGKPLGDVVSEAVVAVYGERPVHAARRPVKLPVSGKGGLLPGVDLDDSDALADRMDRVD